MSSNNDSGIGRGAGSNSQTDLMEYEYERMEEELFVGFDVPESEDSGGGVQDANPKYSPTSKHDKVSGYGSPDPIKSQVEGQRLLETGYKSGKQYYNITDEGKIVKFQPANTPEKEYHAYEVTSPRDIPPNILRKMRDEGKISPSDYKKFIKNKK